MEASSAANQRIIFIDFAKVLCTILVVFGHLYSAYSIERIIIYTFHMPLFFWVSGMFHKQKPIGDSIVISLRRLIIPALFYLFIYLLFIIPFDFCGYHGSFEGNWGQCISSELRLLLEGFVKGSLRMPNSIIWFLFALFYCRVFADCSSRYKYFLPIYLFFLFLAVISKLKPAFISQALVSFPFYWFGYKSRQSILSLATKKNSKTYFLFLFAFAILIIAPLFNGKVSIAVLRFGELQFPLNLFCFYIAAIAGTFVLLFLSSYFNKRSRLISIVSTAMISVVGFQEIFIVLYKRFIGLDQSFGFTLISSIVIISTCILLHYLFSFAFPSIWKRNIN